MKILKTVGAAATLLAAGLAYAATATDAAAPQAEGSYVWLMDQTSKSSTNTDNFFTVDTGGGYNNAYYCVYNGDNYAYGLKIQSTNSITFTATSDFDIKIVSANKKAAAATCFPAIVSDDAAVSINLAEAANQTAYKQADIAGDSNCHVFEVTGLKAGNYTINGKNSKGENKEIGLICVSVTYTGDGPIITALAAPQITITDQGVVTIAGPEGATVQYTTDGSEPSASVGETYTAPFTLSEAATVKAIALGDGVSTIDSRVASKAWAPIVVVSGYEWYVTGDKQYSNTEYFTTGGTCNTKYAWAYNGLSCDRGLKLDSSGSLAFANDQVALVTVVQPSANNAKSFKFDGNLMDALLNVSITDNRISKLFAAPGAHTITRGSGEAGLAYVAVEYVEPYTLPTDADMNFNNANIFKARENSIENEGAALGSTQASTQAQFFVSNTVEQPYYLQFMAGHGQGAGSVWNATVKSVAADGTLAEVAAADFTIPQTNGWTPQYQCELPIANLPVGTYEVTLTAKSTPEGNSYAGNIGALRISAESAYNTLPGQWNLGKALMASGVRYQDESKELGYVKNGTSATYTVNVTEPGEYTMIADFTHYNNSFVDFTVTDIATGQVEATASIERTAATTAQHIRFNGAITAGLKTVEMKFTSASDGYLFNLSNVSFEHSAELKQPHLCGEMNGWSTDNEAYLFTSTDDVHYTLRLPRLYGEWKITLDGWYTAAGEQALAADMPLTADNSVANFTLWSQSETLLTLTLGADGTPATLRVDGQYAHPVYFCGEQTDWLNGKIAMKPMGDNVYELTIPEGLSGEWKLNDGSWDWNFGTTGWHEGGVLLDWKENEAWFGKDNFKHLTTGSTFIRFTLVEGSDNAGAGDPSIIWIQEEGNIPVYLENPDFWDEVRIHFWNGSHDTTWPGAAMHAAGTYADSSINLMAEGEPQILEIALPAGTSHLIFNNNDKGEKTEDLDVYPGHIYRLTKNADGSIAATHSLYNGTTGVEDVTVEAEGQTEYYDLRGIRVTNPQPGHIYIVRQGAKTSKVRF